MTVKSKLSSVVTHIKEHPIPYTVAATATVTLATVAIAAKTFLDEAHLVNLTSNAARMRNTGKGLYFDLEDGGTIAMFLEELLDEPIVRI